MPLARFASSRGMARTLPPSSDEYPLHLSARCINKEWFQIPLEEVWEIMENYLYFAAHGYGLKIHAFVLMQNHWHLIAECPNGNLSEAMRYFMRESSRSISRTAGRINQTYGGRFFRCSIRSPHYYLHAYKYVYRNPVKAGLVNLVEQYRFSTLHGLLGFRKMAIPMIEDFTLFSDVEGTINWLNRTPTEEDTQAVRKALRRPGFKLPRSGRHTTSHPLVSRMY